MRSLDDLHKKSLRPQKFQLDNGWNRRRVWSVIRIAGSKCFIMIFNSVIELECRPVIRDEADRASEGERVCVRAHARMC